MQEDDDHKRPVKKGDQQPEEADPQSARHQLLDNTREQQKRNESKG